MLAAVVRRRDTERARRELLRAELLDRRRRVVARNNRVEIPVISPPKGLSVDFALEEQSEPVFNSKKVSFQAMKEYLRGYIGGKAGLIKGGWELVGGVLILSLPEELYPERRRIGEAILEFHPRARSVVVRERITHPFRKPLAEVVAGDRDTATLHKENGILFSLDPLRVMFSAGNFSERERMAYISSPEEEVLDMFSGVGQFSLPMAKHSQPRKVVAVEKSAETYSFLEENVALNRLDNVEARHGDNREVSPASFAHRVLMGYLFSPEKYIPVALGALKAGGGVVHFHALVQKPELEAYGRRVVRLINRHGWGARVAYSRIVKPYAPKLWHAVYDLEVRG